jgi:hypothetical protein
VDTRRRALIRLSFLRELGSASLLLAYEFGPGSHVRALAANSLENATLGVIQEAVDATESVCRLLRSFGGARPA